MRVQLLIAIVGGAALWASGGVAHAQFGPASGPTYGSFGPTGPYAPNFYNRQTQPLSPYLNLLRGGNPAVNYYYGVRPGTMAGAYPGNYGNPGAMNLQRQTFFPYVDTLAEFEPGEPRSGIGPTGHSSGFNNTLGYFGGTLGPAAGGQGQQGMGGGRRGVMPPRR